MSLPECLPVEPASPASGTCRYARDAPEPARSACLPVEPASPAPGTCRCARQAPEPAGISMPAASPAGVALRLPVRQSGANRRNQTVGIRVGTEISEMAESCAYSVTCANLARSGSPHSRNPSLHRIKFIRLGRTPRAYPTGNMLSGAHGYAPMDAAPHALGQAGGPAFHRRVR